MNAQVNSVHPGFPTPQATRAELAGVAVKVRETWP